MIADGLDTPWGYGFGEQSLARMPDGDLLCVMRTLGSEELGETDHLAAARSATRQLAAACSLTRYHAARK